LSADEARALGIVPFRETDEEVLIACAAPVPYSAIWALQELSGRRSSHSWPTMTSPARGDTGRRLRANGAIPFEIFLTALRRSPHWRRRLATLW
jgi:hypothetical protein